MVYTWCCVSFRRYFMAQITINGQQHQLQNFVIHAMKLLMRANAISADEMTHLQDSDYCRQTFNLHYPLLSSDFAAFRTDESHSRYYAQETFFENNLYLCNHWFDENSEPFLNWFLHFFE